MWYQNYWIQHKMKDIGFNIELHFTYFPQQMGRSLLVHVNKILIILYVFKEAYKSTKMEQCYLPWANVTCHCTATAFVLSATVVLGQNPALK